MKENTQIWLIIVMILAIVTNFYLNFYTLHKLNHDVKVEENEPTKQEIVITINYSPYDTCTIQKIK